MDTKWKTLLNLFGNEVKQNAKYTADKNDPKLVPLLMNLSASYKFYNIRASYWYFPELKKKLLTVLII